VALSQNEIDALRAQIEACFKAPAAAADAKNLIVEVRIRLNPDGSLSSAPLVTNSGSGHFPPGLRHGPGGRGVEAARLGVQVRPLAALGEGQEPGGACGAPDRGNRVVNLTAIDPFSLLFRSSERSPLPPATTANIN
jgi:hypothetical protein